MKKWIYGIILIICLCVGGFCAYQAWLIYNEDNEVELQTDKIKKECVVKKDENGDLVYSRVFLSLQKNDGSGSWLTGDDVTAAFSSTLAGMIRSHIQNGVVILNPQVDKDLIAAINEELSGRYDISLISYYTMAADAKGSPSCSLPSVICVRKWLAAKNIMHMTLPVTEYMYSKQM